MEVLLINPLLAPNRPPEVCNIGLAYVAAVLRREGHQVEVLDLDARRRSPEDVRDVLRRTEFDVAGIGTLISGFSGVRSLTRLIREVRPEARVWIGNSVGTPIPEMLLREIPADVVVIGEGEETVKELAAATERGASLDGVAGIAYRSDEGIRRTADRPVIADIDTIPLPAWDLFDQKLYSSESQPGLPPPKMYIISTRGCPYPCTYCYHPFQNSKVRFHSAERVAEEIAELEGRYGIRSIIFADDLFVVNKKRVFEICDLMEKRRLKIRWAAAGRINTVDEDLLRRMKSAGCNLIGFGIESGSQTVLDNIKKRTTVEQGRKAIALCRKVGLPVSCSFMVGNVGETRETVAETVGFIKTNDLPPTVFFYATPYPGTELYEHGLRQGLIKDEVKLVESYGEQNDNLLVNFTAMPDAELAAVKKAAEDDLFVSYGRRHPVRWALYYLRHLRYNVKIHGWVPVLRRIARKAARLTWGRPAS